jgi:polyisoprenoid-binding protein YceI
MKLHAAAVLLTALASACVQLPRPEPVQRQAPADFPEAYYRQAQAQGKAVFRVDRAQSLVVVEVRRGGSLARIGHDHVVASHDLAGYVASDEGRADLYVPLERLVVDEPELRAESKFESQPTDSDIEGTRSNMLEKVLEAERFPFALIRVSRIDSGAGRVDVAITLHGTTRELKVPAEIEANAREVAASGRLELKQTDFGIVPYSILGGAIQVQDLLTLRFRIRALRLD